MQFLINLFTYKQNNVCIDSVLNSDMDFNN